MMKRAVLAEEVSEALAPLDTWRYAAAIERTDTLNAMCQDSLITLMWWGWAVSVTRVRGAWTITAGKSIGSRTYKARVTGIDYYAACYALRNRLLAVLDGSESDLDEEIAA
ncbi:MAG: hypothetical protein WBA46_00320 [Thermomicrobiales bacterium]